MHMRIASHSQRRISHSVGQIAHHIRDVQVVDAVACMRISHRLLHITTLKAHNRMRRLIEGHFLPFSIQQIGGSNAVNLNALNFGSNIRLIVIVLLIPYLHCQQSNKQSQHPTKSITDRFRSICRVSCCPAATTLQLFRLFVSASSQRTSNCLIKKCAKGKNEILILVDFVDCSHVHRASYRLGQKLK